MVRAAYTWCPIFSALRGICNILLPIRVMYLTNTRVIGFIVLTRCVLVAVANRMWRSPEQNSARGLFHNPCSAQRVRREPCSWCLRPMICSSYVRASQIVMMYLAVAIIVVSKWAVLPPSTAQIDVSYRRRLLLSVPLLPPVQTPSFHISRLLCWGYRSWNPILCHTSPRKLRLD